MVAIITSPIADGVKAASDDSVGGPLIDELDAGANIVLSEIDAGGGNKKVRITASGGTSAYLATSNPTPQNDDVDTAGIGQAFATGDLWVNTDANNMYACTDNTTNAAIWEQVDFTTAFQLLFVTSTGDDSNDGLSWNTPKLTIQSALANAQSGDIIYVAAGTYDFPSQMEVNIGVSIIGVEGAANTIMQRTGTADHRVLKLAHSRALVKGFTIQDGYLADGDAFPNGGNVWIQYGGTLEECIVDNGSCEQYGGGVFISDPSGGYVYKCTFINNTVRGLGGGGGGGGVYCDAVGYIDSCLFYDNTAPSGGGVATNTSAYQTVVSNCTMTENTATGWGGLYYGGGFSANATGIIVNCIVYNNTPNDIFLAYYWRGADCIYNDHGTIQTVGGGSITGVGNITTDPLFTDAASDDFTLQAISPCIQGAIGKYQDHDIDNDIRVDATKVTIGCYEYKNQKLYQETITDDTTTNIILATAADINGMYVDYSLIVDTRRRSGVIYIAHDGSVTAVRDEYVDLSTDIPIIIGADIDSGNIRLNLVATSVGSNATFTYTYRSV